MNDNGQFKVRLTDSVSQNRLEDRPRSVQFDVTPDLIENRNINYKTLDPVHAPGQLYVFANSSSRTFNLSNVRLISRTAQEASKNLRRLWTLRSWCVPEFGLKDLEVQLQEAARERSRNNLGSIINDFNKRNLERQLESSQLNFLGAPPAVLLLTAYSRHGGGLRGTGHIRRVPVVIQQLSIPYPSDTDYIPTAEEVPTPMPTIMTLDMTLVETHSPQEYQNFSLRDFREGNLTGF